MGFRGVQDARFATTRRLLLLLRGGKFCNHEEVAKSGVLGDFESGGIASLRMLNYRVFFKMHTFPIIFRYPV